MRFTGWSLFALCLYTLSASAAEPRVTLELGSGWRFKQAADLSGVESRKFDDSSWGTVEVPHSWNRIGNEGTVRSPLSNSVQGVGWYRLRFKAPPAAWSGARYFLQFDGVGAVADVWLNGHYLGKHAGAFSRFRFDASAAIDASGENLLVVKADNSRPEPGSATASVIPLSGDFFVFGGIYRNVSLLVTQPSHIDLMDFGGPGVYARALEITPAAATVHVAARLVHDAPRPEKVSVVTDIADADGKVLVSTSSVVPSLATKVLVSEATVRLDHPRLWQGIKDPYLYRVIVTLRGDKGAVLDSVSQPLGLRTMRFDRDKGFFLNGEHVFLHGASMHQDRPVKGWAISRADQKQDLELLTDMGGNAVRFAHYQHDQYSYELADSLGVVAWAEIPLVNKVSFDGTPVNEALTANAIQQLTELIRQNFNHPSVAVWSIANEIDLTATQVKGPSKPTALLQALNLLAKAEDPSRSTTMADCCELGLRQQAEDGTAGTSPRDAIVGITETVGYNRYFGWYSGHYNEFGPMLDTAHARHPEVPMAVSEYGASAALTQHTDDATGGPVNPHGRPHPEELQNLYHEASWDALRTRPYLWGVFVWNLFDFSSDSRQEGDLMDINEKGLVSYDREIRKDAFYFYRANWSTQPTLHLVGRRYVDRAYAVFDVKAYSNASEARLSLNGADLGMTPCAVGICRWHAVHLAEGKNDLRATATVAGAAVGDALQWSFAGSPAIVRIKAGDISGYVALDNQRYGSDMYFNGGEGKAVNAPDTPAEKRIAVAADDARLYDSFREGEFSYRVPVPKGRYRIVLKFAEPTAAGAGERVFDVIANGATVLQGFDVFAAAGGKLKGVERTFEAKSSDGNLVIAFRPRKGQALVTAIAVTPLAGQ